MTCKLCNQENDPSSQFCEYCGVQLQIICTSCGKTSSQLATFCRHCGDRIDTVYEVAQAENSSTNVGKTSHETRIRLKLPERLESDSANFADPTRQNKKEYGKSLDNSLPYSGIIEVLLRVMGWILGIYAVIEFATHWIGIDLDGLPHVLGWDVSPLLAGIAAVVVNRIAAMLGDSRPESAGGFLY